MKYAKRGRMNESLNVEGVIRNYFRQQKKESFDKRKERKNGILKIERKNFKNRKNFQCRKKETDNNRNKFTKEKKRLKTEIMFKEIEALKEN